MSLLIPLGLLGLLGLLVLLIIYIIKPNYQQKLLSSTFVWKLSLKYQKKRLPINKLRNILILICQILIIALLAMILTQPAVVQDGTYSSKEKVIVIDASASMLATTRYDSQNYTRFDQAVDGVIDLVEKTFDNGGTVTIILAGETSEFLADESSDGFVVVGTPENIDESNKKVFSRVGADMRYSVLKRLGELKSECDPETNNPLACTYGSADIEGAMDMAGKITSENPLAEVVLFTGKKYMNNNGVTVVDVSRGAEEVNVAVLDMRAVLEEGYYTFYADVASYGENVEVDIDFLINVNVNGAEYVNPVHEIFHRSLRSGEVVTVIFDTNSELRADGSKRPVTDYVYTYSYASVSVNFEGDAIEEDNSITLYGGVKPVITVQYASSAPSSFFGSALMSIEIALRSRWDIDVDEVRGENGVVKTSGYDFYIFEHTMPSEMPTDGVVFLVNPLNNLPEGLGVLLERSIANVEKNLLAPDTHPLLNYMNVSNLMVTSYRGIGTYPEGYTTVMQCDGKPVFICKNTAAEKIAIMSFSTGYSDFAVKVEFPTLVYNMFEYFIPSTFTQYIYDVNDVVEFKSRGESLVLKCVGHETTLQDLPQKYKLTKIGNYSTTQSLFGVNDAITENFFVKMPADESNIGLVVDVMPGSVVKTVPPTDFDDLLVYFAAALVALLLIEWWLQSRSRV